MFNVITSTASILSPEVTNGINGLFALGFQTLLLVLVAGLTWALKLGLGTIKNGIVRAFARRAVAYAQQRLMGNEEKRKYVAEQIHKKFPRISQNDAEQFLEEAVVSLKSGLESVDVVK